MQAGMGAMSQGFSIAFGGGLLSAVLYVTTLSGSLGALGPGGSLGTLVLGYLMPLPMFLVGFNLGFPGAVLAVATGGVLVLGISGSPIATLIFVVAYAAPVAAVVHQALLSRPLEGGGVEWFPPGGLIMLLVGSGLAFLGLAFVVTLGQDGGLLGLSERVMAAMAGGTGPADGVDAAQTEAMFQVFAPILPAGLVLSWLVMLVINALLAQGVLVRFDRNLRPSMSLAEVALPTWTAPALAAALAAAFALPEPFGNLGLNATIVLLVPFFFAGLAVVHAFADQHRARGPILLVFYLFMLLSAWPIPVVAVVGVADQWLDLRRRAVSAPVDRRDE